MDFKCQSSMIDNKTWIRRKGLPLPPLEKEMISFHGGSVFQTKRLVCVWEGAVTNHPEEHSYPCSRSWRLAADDFSHGRWQRLPEKCHQKFFLWQIGRNEIPPKDKILSSKHWKKHSGKSHVAKENHDVPGKYHLKWWKFLDSGRLWIHKVPATKTQNTRRHEPKDPLLGTPKNQEFV